MDDLIVVSLQDSVFSKLHELVHVLVVYCILYSALSVIVLLCYSLVFSSKMRWYQH